MKVSPNIHSWKNGRRWAPHTCHPEGLAVAAKRSSLCAQHATQLQVWEPGANPSSIHAALRAMPACNACCDKPLTLTSNPPHCTFLLSVFPIGTGIPCMHPGSPNVSFGECSDFPFGPEAEIPCPAQGEFLCTEFSFPETDELVDSEIILNMKRPRNHGEAIAGGYGKRQEGPASDRTMTAWDPGHIREAVWTTQRRLASPRPAPSPTPLQKAAKTPKGLCKGCHGV